MTAGDCPDLDEEKEPLLLIACAIVNAHAITFSKTRPARVFCVIKNIVENLLGSWCGKFIRTEKSG